MARKNSSSKILIAPPLQLRPHSLRPMLRGILESVEPAEDGLLLVTMASERQMFLPEELEPHLKPLVGRRAEILRIGDYYHAMAVEVA